jgi:hypothetical protein
MAVLKIVFSRFFLTIANSTVFHLEYDLLSKRYLRPLLFQRRTLVVGARNLILA